MAAPSTAGRRARLAQRPIHRRRAHRQQIRANLGRQLQVAVPFHRIDQDRNQRPQPLAANAIGRFPHHNQRLAHRVTI
jgi:hypothetical protein